MAKPPIAAAAAAPTPAADDAAALAPADDGAAMDDGASEEDTSEVLLTVCKEADGTYRLIPGDEDDAAAPAEGDAGAGDATEGKIFDSVGALLKAIMDLLNEAEGSSGEDGSSEDQFQAGFGGPAGAETGAAAPAAPMAQKY